MGLLSFLHGGAQLRGPLLSATRFQNRENTFYTFLHSYKAQDSAIPYLTLHLTLPAETLQLLRMTLNNPENTFLHSYISRNSVTPRSRQLHTFLGDCHQMQLVRTVLGAPIPRGLSSDRVLGWKAQKTPQAETCGAR